MRKWAYLVRSLSAMQLCKVPKHTRRTAESSFYMRSRQTQEAVNCGTSKDVRKWRKKCKKWESTVEWALWKTEVITNGDGMGLVKNRRWLHKETCRAEIKKRNGNYARRSIEQQSDEHGVLINNRLPAIKIQTSGRAWEAENSRQKRRTLLPLEEFFERYLQCNYSQYSVYAWLMIVEIWQRKLWQCTTTTLERGRRDGAR